VLPVLLLFYVLSAKMQTILRMLPTAKGREGELEGNNPQKQIELIEEHSLIVMNNFDKHSQSFTLKKFFELLNIMSMTL